MSGKKITVGNENTGREATAGKITVKGPDGETGSAGYIKGEQGTVGRSGDTTFAAKDGNVYVNKGDGWHEVTPPRERRRFRRSNYSRTLTVNNTHAIWDSNAPAVSRQTVRPEAGGHRVQGHLEVEASEVAVAEEGAGDKQACRVLRGRRTHVAPALQGTA